MKTIALTALVSVAAFATFDAPIVQVRDFTNSSTIAVVAWDPGDAQYGLRTRIARDGSVLGEARRGEDRLYLSSAFVDAHGGFGHAVAQDGKLLRNTGMEKDPEACHFGNACSPTETIGLGVPDEWLRQHRDSVVVTLRPQTGQNWSIRLDRPLIDAYLATIDSVSASLKKK